MAIKRTYSFADGRPIIASQLDVELSSIVDQLNQYDRGIAKWMNLYMDNARKIGFYSSSGLLSSLIGYVINNFVIAGDSTNGLNLYGNGGNISLGETSGSYGGGSKVVFIPNRSVAPTSNPTGGGILYAEGGALKWRGSGGTVTTIAPA